MTTTPLAIGIIGSGNRGIDTFGRLLDKRDDAQVVALADPNHLRLAANAKKLKNAPRAYASAEAMLDAETLDAVIVTSPDHCHEEHATIALQRGVNVLIDKPLATTVAGCQRVMSAAESSGAIAMIGFNLRHAPVLQRLKKLIDDGDLGRVFLVENREFYNGGRTYMSRWNRLQANSGGLWIHKGSHDFDVFNWLLGYPKPVRVSATASVSVLNADNLPFPLKDGVPAGPTCRSCAYRNQCPDVFDLTESPEWSDAAAEVDGYQRDLCMYLSEKDTHDNGIATVDYENGVRASHLECFVTSMTDRLYTIVGDRGLAEASLHDMRITVRPRWTQEVVTYQIPEARGGHGGADPLLLEQFIATIQGKREGGATLEQGMWATAIGQAAELSVKRQATVSIDELFADS